MSAILDLDTHPEAHVTPAELAAYWCVNVKTIYRDISKGALAAIRLPGGALRIKTKIARDYGKPTT